jgi:predicted transcriptional regulator
MRKSKLESYEGILESLVNKPLTFEHLAYKSNMDCTILRQQTEFLIKNGLIEERASKTKTSYAITERGIAVLRALNFQKYLAKIKDTISAIDEAYQVIPDIARDSRKSERQPEG